ncbi:hypothetical protein [Flavobacterium orientale]|uniref:Uncharacterized protein n=1 Tax=Flavobacterium orientale TaxID=1756020 RepID=A0A916XZH3_9FLAO|nr:hypothetical protein [Flavobacterium orientale]GGD24009.1 hypothetical protein GCM10011343_12740 [Flavobacterium orientale]
MKQYSLFYLVGLILLSCSNSNTKVNPEAVTDHEVYAALKLAINDLKLHEKQDGTENYYIEDVLKAPVFKTKLPRPTEKLTTYFSEEDLAFLEKQLAERENYQLAQDSISPKKLISHQTIDSLTASSNYNKNEFLKNYNLKFGENYFTSFSLPLYSLDKKTIYIDCNTIFGGRSIIYKKTNGKWKATTFMIWH